MKSSKGFKRFAYRLALIMVMTLGFSTVAWTQGHGQQAPRTRSTKNSAAALGTHKTSASSRSQAAVSAPLVPQALNYTENPVDVPNPDRGFERSNDDASGNTAGQSGGTYSYMRVPASANTILCQPFVPAFEMSIGPNYQVEPQPFYLGGVNDAPGMPGYLNVPVYPRIIQFYLVLNEFSSNAQTDSQVGNCSKHANVGTDGPITQYGLDYISSWLQFIRDNTNSVVHIRVNYDPKGWDQIVWDEDNLIYADSDTGHTNPFTTPAEIAANIAQPLADTWRGSSPIYRQCTVPGFENMNWVQYHYYQLAPIFQEYHDIIWAFDSGTFGPWGESHSNYDAEDPNNYKMVLDSLLAAVPDNKIIMTHLGGFLAWYNRTYNTQYTFGTLDQMPPLVRGTPEARFGMFEDSASDFSEDEWSYNDDGSASEGYRMLAHDPTLPGYDPVGVDPSLRKGKCSNSSTTSCNTNNFTTVCGSGNTCVIAVGSQSSGGGDPIIGYNDSGTNRLEPLSEPILQPDGDTYTTSSWRAVWFTDWDRTKNYNFYGLMADHGGEQIGNEPSSGTDGCYVPPGNYNDSPCSNAIQRFPVFLYEGSITRRTYLDMQQGSGSYLSRANVLYTQANIAQTFTLPQSGQQITPIFDPVYEGQSALDYYRDRMGFRFVLRQANASAWTANGDGILQFDGQIQNVGWGQLFNKKAVTVILKSPTTGFTSNFVLTDIDPYDWQPAPVGPVSSPATTGASYGAMPDSTATNTNAWHDFNFAIPMSSFGVLPVGEYNIYLKINDPNEQYVNKRSIQFANNGVNTEGDNWDSTIAANLIGSTKVILSPDDVVTFTTPAPASAEYGSTFTVAASGNPGTGAITYTSDGVVCTNSGATYTMIQGSGTCTVTATQAADSNYASASASEYITATNAVPGVSVATSGTPSIYGQPVTFTATITSDTGAVKGRNGAARKKPMIVTGNVTWSGNTGCGTTSVTSGYPGTATCTTTIIPAGTDTITATYNGDGNHATAAGSLSGGQTVNQASQTITVSVPAPPTATNGSSFTVVATGGGSGNPVVFTSFGACSNLRGTYTMNLGKACTVTMNQAGNANYTAAPTVTETTTEAAAIAPTVSVTVPASAPYQSTFTPVATTNASTTPTITVAPATVCTISGGVVTMENGTGTCSVTAKWAADDVYKAANATAKTTASKLASVVTWATPDPITYGTALSATQLDATASVPGMFVYTPASGKVLAVGTQTLSVKFTPTQSTDYTTVTGTTVPLVVNPANTTTTITTTSVNPSIIGHAVTVYYAVASPGKVTGSVAVTASSGETCGGPVAEATGLGSCRLTLQTVGSITLTATYGGDANNNGSVSAGFTQTVN